MAYPLSRMCLPSIMLEIIIVKNRFCMTILDTVGSLFLGFLILFFLIFAVYDFFRDRHDIYDYRDSIDNDSDDAF